MELLKNWICVARGSSWPLAQAGCIARPPLSQKLSLNKCGGNGRPEGSGRNSAGGISVHLIHVWSPWFKGISNYLKKKKIGSSCGVSSWAWKTFVFDSFDLIGPWKDGGNCHQNISGLVMNRKSDPQHHIMVGCRQLIDLDLETLKAKQPLIPRCLKHKSRVTSALPLDLRL